MKKLIIIPALFVTLIIGLMYITGTHDTPTMEKPVQQGCGGDSVSCDETIVIPDSHEAAEKYISRKTVVDNKLHITMFYSYDCPHCKDALVFFEKLVNVDPQSADEQYGNEIKKYMDNSDKNIKIVVDAYEIKQNINNRKIFKNFADDYDTELKGVPMIFIGEKSLVGFSKDSTPGELINEILFLENKGSPAAGVYKIPFLGKVTADSISLPYFTVVLGLLDGFNPCAMWVLLFLLGILVHAGSREKVFFIGIIFVLTSGAVYFAFMTAWLNLFLIIGFSRVVTIILASAAIFMGLINLKEIIFFKKGLSLMIPDSAKPKLYKKVRELMKQKNMFFAAVSTVLLAMFVNLIELACTAGFPAIFTKILSDRNEPVISKYLYMLLYNIMYVLPLFIIVVIFTITMGHFKMKESHAKILKFISGVLMICLGILLLTGLL